VLAAAILVAAASFVLLIAAGRTTEIRVRGSVESNYRTAYDILVRPRGSQLPLEREQGLVRNNYLSGLFGGIALKQWREIKGVPGVDVAAPVANIGFVIPRGFESLRLNPVLTKAPTQLYRIRFTTLAHQGKSRYPLKTDYVYYTRRNAFAPLRREAGYREIVGGPDGGAVEVCSGVGKASGPGPFRTIQFTNCYSARSPGLGSDVHEPGVVRVGTDVAFPILLAAIDPDEEARLLNLDRTVISGRYLRTGERAKLQRLTRTPATYHRLVPVIASTRTYVDEHVEARVERLEIPAGINTARTLASSTGDKFLAGLEGRVVASRTLPAEAFYEDALAGIYDSPTPKNISGSYWRASPTRYRETSRLRLHPRVVRNPLSVWRADPFPGGARAYEQIAPANADIQFRRLHARVGSIYWDRFEVPGGQVMKTPVMRIIGRYDPRRLPGFSPLSRVPLETYYPPELLPADDMSRRALRGKPLLPSQNIGDYVAQPPLFLTTLEAMRPFLRPKYYAGAREGAPISVIRVRVKGVTGPDELSHERVKAVATEIHERTGLQVDITAGSSPRTLLVDLPPGKFGRPRLLLEEGWSKKGVSVSFLEALDEKRLGLLALILVSCGFFVANGAFASVRSRRRELGTLLCLGWSQAAIFSVVLAELALIGLAAGLLGSGVAGALASAFSLDVSVARSALVAPLALAVAVVAGIVPALRAARMRPLEAVTAPVIAGERRRPIRRLAALALANVRRVPGRSLIAVAALAVGVAALTLLVAINQAFQGTLVGTLLGEAISVQIQALDFLTVGLVVALATLSLADVLFLNLRERAAELVTLRTVGWDDRQLARVIAMEALSLGLFGSLVGAGVGFLLGVELGISFRPLVFAAAAGVVGGAVVALLASLLPLSRLSTLRPGVLAEE
jgi:putative ABC transport system permease protein